MDVCIGPFESTEHAVVWLYMEMDPKRILVWPEVNVMILAALSPYDCLLEC